MRKKKTDDTLKADFKEAMMLLCPLLAGIAIIVVIHMVFNVHV